MKKSLHQNIGGFDEENFKGICYDIDLCLRLQEGGWRNVWSPFAEMYHDTSVVHTELQVIMMISRKNWMQKWKFLSNVGRSNCYIDPAYNPNLTLAFEDFSLAWPPNIPRLKGRAHHFSAHSPMQL